MFNECSSVQNCGGQTKTETGLPFGFRGVVFVITSWVSLALFGAVL